MLGAVWFLLLGVLLAGYAILDGFDLGVGVLHLFERDERRRRVHLAAIGPVWDGNEVWLLTAGGAMFAAFPFVYATVFSGFYLAFMLLLAALIFRATALEFRHHVDDARWQRFWDWAFGLGSLVPALLYGVAMGNIIRGLPINADGLFTGSFLGLLNPYSLLVGVFTLAFFTMHGAIYLAWKGDEDARFALNRRIRQFWRVCMGLYGLATVATAFSAPHAFAGVFREPLSWAVLAVVVGASGAIPAFLNEGRYGCVFIASSLMIAAMLGLVGLSLYPALVPSSTDPAYSLTIENASSTDRTLGVMLIIALIGMPLVIAYQALIYWIFRDAARDGDGSY